MCCLELRSWCWCCCWCWCHGVQLSFCSRREGFRLWLGNESWQARYRAGWVGEVCFLFSFLFSFLTAVLLVLRLVYYALEAPSVLFTFQVVNSCLFLTVSSTMAKSGGVRFNWSFDCPGSHV